MQGWDVHALAGVEAVGNGGAHVVQQDVVRGADQHRQTLTHVDHGQLGFAGRREVAIGPEQRQP
jgi:hypothetical protein